jgi:putative chitinase
MTHWIDEALLVVPATLTGAKLKRMMPGCKDPELWADLLGLYMDRYGLDTKEEIALFLAQVGHESKDLNATRENMNYSVEGLLKTFGRHRITEEEARAYGRTSSQPANQRMIANTLYGGDWGRRNLGNTQANDGWDFRGGGLIHLTGRGNYERCAQATGLDIVRNPDLLVREPAAAVESALWFWRDRVSGTNIKTTTRQVNGGENGLADRTARYNLAVKVLGV